MLLDFEKFLDNPRPLTGHSSAELQWLIDRWQGTPNQLISILIYCHLSPKHEVIAQLLGNQRPNVTVQLNKGKEELQRITGQVPKAPIDTIKTLADLLDKHPEVEGLLKSDAAIAA